MQKKDEYFRGKQVSVVLYAEQIWRRSHSPPSCSRWTRSITLMQWYVTRLQSVTSNIGMLEDEERVRERWWTVGSYCAKPCNLILDPYKNTFITRFCTYDRCTNLQIFGRLEGTETLFWCRIKHILDANVRYHILKERSKLRSSYCSRVCCTCVFEQQQGELSLSIRCRRSLDIVYLRLAVESSSSEIV